MSSFLASLFQSSSVTSSSKSKEASNDKPTATMVTAATTETVVDNSNNDSSNDLLVYMDTMQHQKLDDTGNIKVGVAEEHTNPSEILPVVVPAPSVPIPPPRYFASRLLPSKNNPKASSTSNTRNRVLLSHRSMSKLFTTLPTPNNDKVVEQIPTYSEMMIDLMEYIMYIILLESDISKTIQGHYQDLMNLIQIFRQSYTTGTNMHNKNQPHLVWLLQPSSSSSSSHQHRFSNRMLMTAFACDILQLSPSLQQHQQEEEGNKEETSTNETATATTSVMELPPEGWMELKKRFYALQKQLLSIHANDDPLEVATRSQSATTTTNETVDHPDHSNQMIIDEQLSNHIMMTTDFDAVMTLLSVQQILASFREALEDIKEEQDEDDQIHDSDHSTTHINKMVETCVSTFMKNLSDLFPPSPTMTSTNVMDDPEDDDDYLIGEESEHTKATSNMSTIPTSFHDHGNSNIPKELVSLALIELYSPKQQSTTSTANHHHLHGNINSNIVDRLLYDIRCIITENGISGGSGNDDSGVVGQFSYANLVDKVRSLLLKWSQSILDVPTLVRLGYGGVPSPIVEKDEDDVSSWGSNNNNNRQLTNSLGGNDLLTTTTITVDERQQERRKSRTSFAEALNVGTRLREHPKYRSYSITAEEQDIIARLAATEAAEAAIPKQNELLQYSEADAEGDYPIANSDGLDVDNDDNAVAATQNDFVEVVGTGPSESYPNHGIINNTGKHSSGNGSHTPLVGKVVKASRRLLTSFNFAKDSSKNVNQSFTYGTSNGSNKKRTASDLLEANLSITFDDTKRPEKIRRRNNIWAMNERMKIRINQRMDRNTDSTSPLIRLTPNHEYYVNNAPPSTQKPITPLRKGTGVSEKSPTSSAKKQRRRSFFTDIEVQALLDGIDKYGVGNWSKIQKNDVRLQGRNPSQLKDKYRHIVSVNMSSSPTPSSFTSPKD